MGDAVLKIIEVMLSACSITFVLLCLDFIEYFWSSCDFGSKFSTLSLDIEIKDCELLQPITTSLV